MKNRVKRIALQGLIAACIFLGILTVLKTNPALSFEAKQPPQNTSAPAARNIGRELNNRAVLSDTIKTFLPIMYKPTSFSLDSAWVDNPDGSGKNYFLPGAFARFNTGGSANYTTTVGLQWTLDGPCGVSTIFSDTIELAPGPWTHNANAPTPTCPGYYIATAHTSYLGEQDWLDALLIVNPPSDVITITYPRQGFDACYMLSASQMQTWWTRSPYWVANIYLGGIHYPSFCTDVDTTWVNQVSQQGWAFILTWVGPQAPSPCSSYTYRISSNTSTAYSQGRSEAEDAYDTARQLAFTGDMVIYYDLEAYYYDNQSILAGCRNAVDSFMRGWVERLHQLGVKAGAYGSPVYSYIADWANNNPLPDDVWIAHWLTPYYYRADATVWTPYLDDSLWANHQRIRQYTGGHSETWGGVTKNIDSNALDGEVTILSGAAPPGSSSAAVQVSISPQIQDTELLTSQSGWMLRENRLLATASGGRDWNDITPKSSGETAVLAADFLDPEQGWMVRGEGSGNNPDSVEVLRTSDGGVNWESSHLSLSGELSYLPAGAFYLEFIDPRNGFLAVKLQSGGSFSLGRLFVTGDGGQTWAERSLPLGEPVAFIDASRGWVAGGPGGGQLFMTSDGGRTWEEQQLNIPNETNQKRLVIGIPQFDQGKRLYLPVTAGTADEPVTLIFSSADLGENWELVEQLPLAQGDLPGRPLPFSVTPDGTWWVGMGSQLYNAYSVNLEAQAIPGAGLPAGVLGLDFTTEEKGWALAQEGSCSGEKTPYGASASEAEPLRCEMTWRLWATEDGGMSWRVID